MAPSRETALGFCLIKSGAIRSCLPGAGRPVRPTMPEILSLIFIVIFGHSRRGSLPLYTKFPGPCKFVVICNERSLECTPGMRHKNKGQFSRGNDVKSKAPGAEIDECARAAAGAKPREAFRQNNFDFL
jgi:hypothetical protein